jgi:hypothetical protein
VRSWIGCGVNTRAIVGNPSDADWTSAAWTPTEGLA